MKKTFLKRIWVHYCRGATFYSSEVTHVKQRRMEEISTYSYVLHMAKRSRLLLTFHCNNSTGLFAEWRGPGPSQAVPNSGFGLRVLWYMKNSTTIRSRGEHICTNSLEFIQALLICNQRWVSMYMCSQKGLFNWSWFLCHILQPMKSQKTVWHGFLSSSFVRWPLPTDMICDQKYSQQVYEYQRYIYIYILYIRY